MKLIYNQKGFSLFEVIIALVLGLALVSAFSGAFLIGFQAEDDMDNRLLIKNIADSTIEYIREDKRDELENINWKDVSANINNIFEETDINAFIKNGSIETIEKNKNLYEVNIILEWEESSYSLSTLLTDD